MCEHTLLLSQQVADEEYEQRVQSKLQTMKRGWLGRLLRLSEPTRQQAIEKILSQPYFNEFDGIELFLEQQKHLVNRLAWAAGHGGEVDVSSEDLNRLHEPP